MTEAAGAVIGINLGQSYGSIACINQHGRADVIANEDGERQLATRIAFDEDQVYIGNQATPQLVRNSVNVIDKFVNLLGRSFSELSEDDKRRSSSPVVDVNGVPSFRVHINGKEEVLSAHDVAVRYIRSLFLTAKDFLSGVPIAGAVLSVPLNFAPKQMTALKDAATEAGLIVLQLVPAPGAALTAYGLTSPQGDQLPKHPDGEEGQPYLPGAQLDRTVVVVDVGGTSSSVSLLQASAGLFTLLAYDVNASVGGATIDEALVSYLAKEFTKKTKVPIEESNARAWAKLRNEAEVTKRSLSASNTAQCSIESLADGVDFSMSVNRMRIDLLSKKVWQEIEKLITAVLGKKALQAAQVDEVILVGGTSRLQGLKDHLGAIFPESTHLTDSVDADQALARGCAVHAQAIATTDEGSVERKHLINLGLDKSENLKELKVQSTTKPVGIVVPAPASLANGVSSPEDEALKRKIDDGKLFVTVVPSKTPLPARRAFTLVAPKDGLALVSLFEGDESVRKDKVERTKDEDEDDDDLDDDEDLDEEDKFVEVETVVVKPSKALGDVVVPREKVSKDGKVRVEVRVDVEGKIKVLVGQDKEQALTSS
ncbi:actin-like ATPase domain-containing protein [Acaromyces ingoldii]|uniref:Actin-like ATPase domain-containing protein n=1 Tax=Acaromyces ingoldii TaxID=215250 RepID=A0A316YJ06_9BASI|nr:actin-like ATPase domain-containing protein [Acaromyces ingoldii]PWN88608.1 actin-like ATPase domain-containing protein [Acaromyces ingoldii]